MSRRAGCDDGQSSVELLVAVPIVLIVGLLGLQMLSFGRAVAAADAAAEAGAVALAAGLPPEPAARRALPGWPRRRVRIISAGGRVEVRLRPAAVIASLVRPPEARATAWAAPGVSE